MSYKRHGYLSLDGYADDYELAGYFAPAAAVGAPPPIELLDYPFYWPLSENAVARVSQGTENDPLATSWATTRGNGFANIPTGGFDGKGCTDYLSKRLNGIDGGNLAGEDNFRGGPWDLSSVGLTLAFAIKIPEANKTQGFVGIQLDFGASGAASRFGYIRVYDSTITSTGTFEMGLQCYRDSGGINYNHVGITGLSRDAWHHVVFTWAPNGDATMYVDAETLALGNFAHFINSSFRAPVWSKPSNSGAGATSGPAYDETVLSFGVWSASEIEAYTSGNYVGEVV
jgi:hypothetical protein